MKKKLLFLKELLKPLILLVVISIPLLFYNLVVDPYKVFFQKFIDAYGQPNKQYMKMKYLLKNKDQYDSFIFGSSRVNFVDPKIVPDGKYYNISYPAGVPSQFYKNIKHLYKNDVEIENLIVGLDYLCFFTPPDADILHFLNRLDYPVTLYEKINFYKTYFFLRPTYNDILKTLKSIKQKKKRGIFKEFYTKGTIIPPRDSEETISKNIDKHVNKSRFAVSFGKYENSEGNFEESLAYVDSIVRFAKSHKINLKIYIHPNHTTTFFCLNFENYLRALKRLSEITDFYDFTGFNPVTNDNYYYYETSHYRYIVGEMIIKSIFNQTDSGCPIEFGKFIDHSCIEEHISNLKEDFFEYSNTLIINDKSKTTINEKDLIRKNNIAVKVTINGYPVSFLADTIKITSETIFIDAKVDIEHYESPINVEIDNHYFKPVQSENKNDKNPKYLDLKFRIPVRKFTPGYHQLRLIYKSRENTQQYYYGTYNIEIIKDNYIGPIPDLKKRGKLSHFKVDFINNQRVRNNKPVIFSKQINLRGWFYDKKTKSVPSYIICYINNTPYISQIKYKRPDLRKKFNNSHLGWGISVYCKNLVKGNNEIKFEFINKEKKSIQTTSKKVHFIYQEE